jgi:hypothetical protein
MALVVTLLAAVVVYLLLRLRRLAREVEDLGDRLTDWRLRLGRNQEELAGEIEALRGAGAPRGPAPGLIQIRGPGDGLGREAAGEK